MTPWDSDEPDGSLDDSCVAYLDGHWYNDPCSEEKPFFCVDGDYNGEAFLSFFIFWHLGFRKLRQRICSPIATQVFKVLGQTLFE